MQRTITDFLSEKADLIKKLTREISSTGLLAVDNPIKNPESELYADELIFDENTKQSEQILQKIVFLSVVYWIFFAMKVPKDSSDRGVNLSYDLKSDGVYEQFQNQQMKFWEDARKHSKNSGAIDLEAWKPIAFEEKREAYKTELKKMIPQYFSLNRQLMQEFIEYFSSERNTSSNFLRKSGSECVKLIKTGKCRDEYFPFSLDQILRFLDSKNLLPPADECIKNLAVYCACVSNENIFFKIIGASLMSRVFIQNKCLTSIATGFIPSYYKFDDEENRILEYSFLSYEQILSCLRLDKNFRKHFYCRDSFTEDFDEFVQICFSKDFDKLPEKEAEYKATELFNAVWRTIGSKIGSLAGFGYCFYQMSKYLDVSFLKDFFVQKNQESLKAEYNKFYKICNENAIPVSQNDLYIGSQIFNQNDKMNDENEKTDYENRKKLLLMMICFALWELFSGVESSKTDENKEDEFHFRFYKLFMEKKWQDEQSVKDLFADVLVFILGDKRFSEKCNVSFCNTETLVYLLFGLSRFYKSREQSIMYLLNFDREQQKKHYPCVPNGLVKVTESQQKENQKTLQENIDFGFMVFISEKVSPLNLYDADIQFRRAMTIKTFVETDKSFNSKGGEDFRLTNKNLLSNHYLYSDRNMHVHFSSPVVVEKLLENRVPEVISGSLDDIQEYLSENEDKSGKIVLPVKLLQNELMFIKEKVNCYNSEEKIKDLLGGDNSFTEDLERFLRVLYGFNINYFKEYGLKIIFYLVFQILVMSK